MGDEITEHKQTDKVLQESEERYRDFFKTSRDCVFITSVDGRWVDLNDAAVQFFGYNNREDLLKVEIRDLYVNPDERTRHIQAINERGYTQEYPVTLRKKDGTIIHTLITSVARKDSTGKIIGYQGTIRDVTKRKRTEEMLRESEERFHTIFENNSSAMAIIERDTTISMVNKEYCRLGLFEEKDVIGISWTSQILPEDLGRLLEYNRKRLIDPKSAPDKYEFSFYRKDGKIRHCLMSVATIPTNGQIVCSFIDITDLKRAIREIEGLAKFPEENPNPVLRIAVDGTIIYANSGSAPLLDMWGIQVGQKLPGDYRNLVLDSLGSGDRKEIEIESAGRIFSLGIAPIQELGYVNIYGQDITERKQTEFIRARSLARQEQLNQLQQTMLVPGKLEQKLEKITDSIVEIFGADFCRIWITSPGDLCEVGCIHAAVTQGPHVCRYRDRCLRLIASSGRYTHTDGEIHKRVPFGCYKIGRIASGEEHKFLTNDVQNDPRIHDREWAKEIGLVSFAGYQLHPPDEDTFGVLALFSKQNITVEENAQLDSLSNTITRIIQAARVDEELRQSRDLLEQRVGERTEELARENMEMEQFIYTVSHDLRTPLISVSGFLGFIEQDAQKGDLDLLKNDLRIINEAVTKMDRLLLETLELSRIGRVVNPPEDVPFGEIVEDALGQTGENIRSKGLKISVAQNLPVVHVDRMRIAEVLINLIENSIKYMGAQEKPEIEIGQRIDGKDKIFFVLDNGIGIDPSQYDKVFELFYKVDRKSEGTGAGLAIVKRIIEIHGGRIWIESKLGKGCMVCFTLPLN